MFSTAIKCPRLRKPHYGEVYPSSCSTKKLYYGAQCAFACRKGFKLKGPSFRQCHGKGSWSGGQIMTRCIGNITIECPCPDNHHCRHGGPGALVPHQYHHPRRGQAALRQGQVARPRLQGQLGLHTHGHVHPCRGVPNEIQNWINRNQG